MLNKKEARILFFLSQVEHTRPVRLSRILGYLCVILSFVLLLSSVLSNISLEYASTAMPFAHCYALYPANVFLRALFLATVILSGIDRLCPNKNVLRLYWGIVPVLLALSAPFALYLKCGKKAQKQGNFVI